MYRPVPSGAADAGTAGRPLHTIRSCLHIMPTTAHRTRRNVDHLAGFAEKPTEKPTERFSVSVSFFFGFFKKTTEPFSTFGLQPCLYHRVTGISVFPYDPSASMQYTQYTSPVSAPRSTYNAELQLTNYWVRPSTSQQYNRSTRWSSRLSSRLLYVGHLREFESPRVHTLINS